MQQLYRVLLYLTGIEKVQIISSRDFYDKSYAKISHEWSIVSYSRKWSSHPYPGISNSGPNLNLHFLFEFYLLFI